MTSKKRRKAREWMQDKTREVKALEARVKQERERAEDAVRARTVFPEKLTQRETADGYESEGFIRFPPGEERVVNAFLNLVPGRGGSWRDAMKSSCLRVRFNSVEHRAEVIHMGVRHEVRWWNWELVEPRGKIEQTISHAAHHLRLALHEHMMTVTTETYGRPEPPLVAAVRNALDEMSLLNGNQIERMNHRVLEQREYTGMNRRRGYGFGDG